jgi:hypothetical protein
MQRCATSPEIEALDTRKRAMKLGAVFRTTADPVIRWMAHPDEIAARIVHARTLHFARSTMQRFTTYLARTMLSLTVGLCVSSTTTAAEMTKHNGSPVGDNQNSQTAGPNGPVLLQDSR